MADDLLQFVADMQLTAAADGAKRPPRVSVLAYSGGVMKPPGWPEVVIDLAGADVAGPIPLLAAHGEGLEAIAGQGVARIADGGISVNGILTDATKAGQTVLALARSGVQLQASVGYQPVQREHVRAGDKVRVNNRIFTAGPEGLTVVRSGRLREVSLVATGADPQSSVAISASLSTKGTKTMTRTNDLPSFMGAETDAVNAEIPDNLRCAWDRENMSDFERIEARLSKFKADYGSVLPTFGQGMLKAAADGSLSWPDAERAILRAETSALRLKAKYAEMPQGPAIHASTRDAGNPGDILQAALLCHLGQERVSAKTFGDQVTQRARDMRATSLVEIIQAAFQAQGMEPPRGREQLIKAGFSTANISNIVSGAQNKILLDQWQRLPLACLQLSKRVSAKDFKDNTAMRLVARNAMLTEVGASGEIEHGNLEDSAATVKLATYAKMYGLNRQQIINDDLQALQDLPQIIARGAGLKMESVFWALVLANTGSFFSEGNGNLITDALALEGLAAAVSAMRRLTDADGEPILVEPKLLVVPPELEAVADTLFASTNVTVAGTGAAVTTQPNGNTFAGKYRPLCSPYISNDNYAGNSDTQWYLFADPAIGPAAFCVALLNGVEAPTIEQQDTDFNTLGVQFRGYLDFGFAQLDKEGAVKSTGAG